MTDPFSPELRRALRQLDATGRQVSEVPCSGRGPAGPIHPLGRGEWPSPDHG